MRFCGSYSAKVPSSSWATAPRVVYGEETVPEDTKKPEVKEEEAEASYDPAVVQAVMKDQRMREQAHLIQGEVANLLADLTRLNERVAKLENHFNQARQDVETIRISTGKIARRGERIATLEFETGRKEAEPSSTLDVGQQGLGRMKLRVVDED